jgi:hypothetical protein
VSNLIDTAKAQSIRPAKVWETATEQDGAILIDPTAAETFTDREVFNDNRRRLRDRGWHTEYVAPAWRITPPAPKREPLKAGASVLERAEFLLVAPRANWSTATVTNDGRTIRFEASRNPYFNKPVIEDLSRLRAAGWDVGEVNGPRGVEAFTATAPLEKATPRSLAEALGQASGSRNTFWTGEGREEGRSLVFDVSGGCSTGALREARAVAGRVRANGWTVSTEAKVGAEIHRVAFTAPRGLVIEK